jgi:ribosomal protein S18 acetylase RimI-like enzyme
MKQERAPDFRWVEENLRESFRALADGRPNADVAELSGVSLASLGAAFQMFNAAFPSQPIESLTELEKRLDIMRSHFENHGRPWAFWCCEDWLAPELRRRLSRTCECFGLRLSAELAGMVAERIEPPAPRLPALDVKRVESAQTLHDFRAVGSVCFHVPIVWFSEVFDEDVAARRRFVCWVGYSNGLPIATAATVSCEGVAGLYNVATIPDRRERGYGEAITRHVIAAAMRENEIGRVVLQSTSQGLSLYRRMGFETVTRILVYSSVR